LTEFDRINLVRVDEEPDKMNTTLQSATYANKTDLLTFLDES